MANANTSATTATQSQAADDKAPKAIKTAVNNALTGLTFTFGTGNKAELLIEKLTPEIRNMAMLHGLRQKVQDAAAISRDPETGRSATFADKEAAAMEVLQRLLAGHWNKPATESRPGVDKQLIRALCELQPQADVDAITAKVAAWSAAEKAALMLNPKVKAILDRMQAENPAIAAIDSDELLAGL